MKKANIELHVHPFLKKNNLVDVVQAMDDTAINVLALESLDASIYPFVVEQTEKHSPSSQIDSKGIRLPNGNYLLNAREYSTREGFHILTVGHSVDSAQPDTEIRRIIEEGLEHDALVLLDHPFADNGKTRTAGHISIELEQELEKICREYSGQIALEWNGYCHPEWRKAIRAISLSLLRQRDVLALTSHLSKHLEGSIGNLFGLAHNLGIHPFNYSDVNQKVEELSSRLEQQGHNIPVVADTDLHARSKRHLKVMGTARVITDLEGESASDILASMIHNIFSGNYINIKNYVSGYHMIDCFFLPILFERHFYKPRG